MTATERRSHRIDETGDIFCGDGYDWMEAAEQKGWFTPGSWGKSGWDLGGWPLVSFSWRKRDDGLWDAVQHVEGDLTFLEGATIEERDAWIDVNAVFHWLVGQSSGPVDDHIDAHGNRTEHQDWTNRVNLVAVALRKHLMTSEFVNGKAVGHLLYGLGTYSSAERGYVADFDIAGGTLWDIHRAMHAEQALREGRTVTNEELVDWMNPDWRGAFSWERCNADKE